MLNDLSYNKEKINHAIGECITWLVSLNLLRDESYTLKTTLSQVLDGNTDKELISAAEIFHNSIIERDEFIKDISVDAKKQERKLNEISVKSTFSDSQWQWEQQKLRNEISLLKNDFAKMRKEFYRKFLNRN